MKLIAVLTLLSFLGTTSSLIQKLTTTEDYSKLLEQSSTEKRAVGVLYFKDDGKEPFHSRTILVMESADERMSNLPYRFMELATVNCSSEHINHESIPQCKRGKRSYFVHLPTASEAEKFSLRQLHDADAFIAEMILHVFSDEVHLTYAREEVDKLLENSIEKKDVVFMVFDALGTPDHYEFMVFFLRNREKYVFAMTTDKDLGHSLGGKKGANAFLQLGCQSVSMAEKGEKTMCPVNALADDGVIEATRMEGFIESSKTPIVSSMNDDGSSIYDNLADYLILHVFVEDELDASSTQVIENLIKRCKDDNLHVRAVVAKRSNPLHQAIMVAVYGVFKTTKLPTVRTRGWQMDDHESEQEPNVEFPLPHQTFTADSLFEFVNSMVSNNADDHLQAVATLNHISFAAPEELDVIQSLKHNTIMGTCERKSCDGFKKDFRKLVRTVKSDTLLNFDYILMEDAVEMPSLSLSLDGKDAKLSEARDYEGMMTFLQSALQTPLQLYPFSGGDSLPIPLRSKYDENKEIPSADRYGDDLLPYQEDEVARTALDHRRKAFYTDDTPALKDENMEEILAKDELHMVFFFLPQIDDVSSITEPLINTIYKEVQDTKIVKVNCEAEAQQACVRAGVHTFPTIRFYKGGAILGTYKGILSKQHIVETIQLYKNPIIQKLDENSFPDFEQSLIGDKGTGRILTLVGWFPREDDKHFEAFEKTSAEYHGQVAFVYLTGESTKHFVTKLPQAPSDTPIITAYINKKVSRTLGGQGIADNFGQSLSDFIAKAQIPAFGELTINNFPTYKSFNKSLLILFVSGNDKSRSDIYQGLSGPMQGRLSQDVIAAWMNTDDPIVKDIQESYLGTVKGDEHLVLVDFKKAEVYYYIERSKSAVNKWVDNCVQGYVTASKYLNVVSWKPLREGFDFLDKLAKKKDDDMDTETEASAAETKRRSRFVKLSSEPAKGITDERPADDPQPSTADVDLKIDDKDVEVSENVIGSEIPEHEEL